MMNEYMDLGAFRDDFNKAMEKLGEKYSIALSAGKITYGENDFSFKVEAKRTDIDIPRMEFEELTRYSFTELKPEDYLRQIEIDGKKFTIKGLKPRTKYSVILEREDGKQYGYTYESVLKALGRR